jgi:PIN domain nuclease of toxin-antitoxin system
LGASQPERIDYDESAALEETDRLLLSALSYWEVQHDLIEERIAAIRSVSVPS